MYYNPIISGSLLRSFCTAVVSLLRCACQKYGVWRLIN